MKAINFRQIHGNFYLIRTQAGFKQAIKHYYEIDQINYKIEGFPDSFPSLCCFNYNEYLGYICDCIHINVLLDQLQGE